MIKVAIIGVGRWGVHWLRNFQQHPLAEVVAVVDPAEERLSQIQQQFNLDPHRVQLATSWSEIKSTVVDAVVVATPASTHYQLIDAALDAGCHVLAEKPLTLDAASSLALTSRATAKNQLLLVDHTYLFHPVVTKGKMVAQSQLGELRYGYASRTNLGPVRYDVDALWDLAIHDLAIFNYWSGETPIQVQAQGHTWLQNESKMNLTGIDAPIADLVWLKLMYASGFEASIHVCWSNPDKQRRLSVVGSEGCLTFDEMLTDSPLVVQQGHFETQQGRYQPAGLNRHVVEVDSAEPLAIVCDTFIRAIINGETDISRSSGEVAAKLVQVLGCLSQSMAQGGQIVTVPELSV